MKDKDYLVSGDFELIANTFDLNVDHVRKIARGERKSTKVETALNRLIEVRKREFNLKLDQLELNATQKNLPN